VIRESTSGKWELKACLLGFKHCSRSPNLIDVPPPRVPTFNDLDQGSSTRCDHKTNHEQFLSLLGKLIFIIKTRPDIASSVNRLATRAQCSTVKDFNSLLRVVSYLGTTQELGITFQRSRSADAAPVIRLFCFVDAASATHPDSRSFSFSHSTLFPRLVP
jgi:hypothetical protein